MFFRNIVVNYWARLMEEESMGVVIEEIFNVNSTLYRALSDSAKSRPFSPNN